MSNDRRHEKDQPPSLFIGREQVLSTLHELLQGEARVITITGTEGVGKSSIAHRYLRSQGHRFGQGDDAARECFLEDAAEADEVLRRVAQVYDVEIGGREGADAVDAIGAMLHDRSCGLLVLDGIDRVHDVLRDLLPRWIEQAPGVRFLLTGRTGLHAGFEVRLKLGPLGVPPKNARDPDVIGSHDAVELFVERARQAVAGWTLKADDARPVAEIVRRLQGVPLAIQIAAARVSAFSPAELLERLPSRVDLLKKRPKTTTKQKVPERVRKKILKRGRHDAVAGTIEWSWRLLQDWERATLAQCAVFRGGFDLDAARAVLDLGDFDDAPSVDDALASLCDKSMLRRDDGMHTGPRRRFQHYAPVRDYATEQLRVGGGMSRAENRHAAYFLEMGRELAAQVDTHGGVERRRRLEVETDNLIAVVRRALGAEPLTVMNVERALSALLALEPVLGTRGPFGIHLSLLDATLEPAEILDVAPTLHARARESRGRARRVRGMMDASLEDLERALELSRSSEEPVWEARALGNIGTHYLMMNELEQAEAYYAEALPLMREHDARILEGRCVAFVGKLAQRRGEIESAAASFEEAIHVHREMGDRRYEGITLGDYAALLIDRGKLRKGAGLLERALQIHREVGNRRYEGLVLTELARVRFVGGRLEKARLDCEESIRIHREVLDRRAEGAARSRMGDISLELGEVDAARTQYDLASTLLQGAGDLRGAALCLGKCACLEGQQGALDMARESIRDAAELVDRLKDKETELAFAVYRRYIDNLLAKQDGWPEEERTMPDLSRAIATDELSTVPGAEDAPEVVQSAARTVRALHRAPLR
jgi:predicted ATPase/Tfp pilus assembly protein PilF